MTMNEEVIQPMSLKFAPACLAAGLLTVLAFAQGPGSGPMGGTPPDPQTMAQRRVDGLARFLNLTDDQKSSALPIFTKEATDSQSIRTSLQTNRQSISDAVKKNDVATIDSLATEAGTLNGQLIAIESKADAAFYAILTADQQTKYDRMLARGPGGPMGPGGFGRMRNRGRQP